jgi:CubicO group peptidase (beta-lactamase class C family)
MCALTGTVEPGFESVRDAFEATLSRDTREGAAFVAYEGERRVVDLAGGAAWRGDTRALVFSCTKALAAVATLALVERGKLGLDEPLHRREGVLLRHVLSHTAALPGLTRKVTRAELLDGARMKRLLESQEPWWEPGRAVAYHPLTYGWLLEGALRHATGLSLAEAVRRFVADPLGLELTLGASRARAARLSGRLPPIVGAPAGPGFDAVYANPRVLSGPVGWWNGPALGAGIPAVGAVGSARDFARLYACLVAGGKLDGVRLLSSDTVAEARRRQAEGVDPVTGADQAFGLGFALQTEALEYGPPPEGFGHDGVGGSIHGAWPAQGVAFAYVTGVMRATAVEGRRILDSLWACISR